MQRTRWTSPGLGLHRPWPALAILLAASAAAWAQDEAERQHGIFTDSIDVSLVNVEVRATLDGRPVVDLQREDFEVLDDGQPVVITNFFRVERGRPVAAPNLQAPGLPGAPVETGGAVPAPPSSPVRQERSSVLVLVDQHFLSLSSRKQIFDQLSQQLDRLMRQGAQVMVVSKTREVVIEQSLTSSREEVEAALTRLARVAAPDWSAEIRRAIEGMERRPLVVESSQTGPGQTTSQSLTSQIDAHSAYQEARRLSLQLHEEVRHSLSLLRRFVGSLAGMPGRKTLLHLADRLPVRAGELVWRVWWAKYGFEQGARVGVASADAAMAEFDSSSEYRELIADANANRVAFYPIGFGTGPDLSSAASRGLSMQARVNIPLTETDDGRPWLASATGGEVALRQGSVERFFDLLQQDLSHYYSLAYPSPHRGDGKRHAIEVRVRRPGVRLRHLTAYRDKSPDQQMTERTLASLLLGVGDNPLGVRIEVGRMNREERGLYRVPVEIAVPVANLVLLPDKTAHLGKLSIQLMVRDDQGRLSDPAMVRLPIEIPHQGILQALSQSAVYPTHLLLRPGRQTIAVGVRDDLGSTGSTIYLRVDVRGRG